jgi:exopolyphosphatase/guanosine-5'-triphosphate,3'-diphosphate pyrophosphatase
MRLAVLDVGSNSAHLRVVDAYPGSPPLPVFRCRTPTRLAESIDAQGRISERGARRLVRAVRVALDSARGQQAGELIPFATSAVRDAVNRDEVLTRLESEAGVRLGYLSGEDEARLTYFAAHRWYGWRTGPLLLLDIGGGSMEVAQGRDEDPAMVVSLPLGAGRLTRGHLPDHPANGRQVEALRQYVADMLAATTERVAMESHASHAVATSKTFKQLARLAGTPTGDPPRRRRVLHRRVLKRWIPRLAAMTPARRAGLPGVDAARARQILAGAVVAETTMKALGLATIEMCPWALREGILLRRLSPLLTPDSLHQIQLIQDTADPDLIILDRRRHPARTTA